MPHLSHSSHHKTGLSSERRNVDAGGNRHPIVTSEGRHGVANHLHRYRSREADDRQDGAYHRQAGSAGHRSAIERFNDRQRAAATGIQALPIGKPIITVDGTAAASAFVRWVAEHDLAREWKVDDLWYLASEDFAPAHDMVLPPRRVFLSALKKTPGVICTPNRRVYDRNGKLLGKTTFYQLPELPVGSIAKVAREITPIKRAA